MHDEPLRDQDSILASFEMGTGGVIVFVEGYDFDPYTYDVLLDRCFKSEVEKNIVKIQDVDLTSLGVARNSSGKNTCLKYFEYLSTSGCLSSREGGYYTIFCLDKDIDDLSGKMTISKHIVYTPLYDIEAVCCVNSDFGEIARSTLCIDKRTYLSTFSARDWKDLSDLWSIWNVECLINEIFHLGETGYSAYPKTKTSSMQEDESFALHKLAILIYKLQTLGFLASHTKKIIIDAFVLVNNSGTGSIFKGKWLLYLLHKSLEEGSKGLTCDNRNLGVRVPQSIRDFAVQKVMPWPELVMAAWLGEEFLATA